MRPLTMRPLTKRPVAKRTVTKRHPPGRPLARGRALGLRGATETSVFLSLAEEAPLDGDDQTVEHQADDRERAEGDEHEGGVEEPLVGDIDEVPEAGVGT